MPEGYPGQYPPAGNSNAFRQPGGAPVGCAPGDDPFCAGDGNGPGVAAPAFDPANPDAAAGVIDPNNPQGIVAQGAQTPAQLLVLETGCIVPGANSYASLEQGNAYHATRLYSDAWTLSTPDTKSLALMMATSVIDANTAFEGRKRHLHQPLNWPRAYVPNDDSLLGSGYPACFFFGWPGWTPNWGGWLYGYLPCDKVPPQVIAATCQMALELLLRNRTQEDPTKGVRSFNIGQGAISFTFDASDRRQVIPDTVKVYLLQVGSVRSPSPSFKKVVRVA
jgi:hypothetical protein